MKVIADIKLYLMENDGDGIKEYALRHCAGLAREHLYTEIECEPASLMENRHGRERHL